MEAKEEIGLDPPLVEAVTVLEPFSSKDGLDVIGDGIEKVRNSVNYWTSSPKRIELFEDTGFGESSVVCNSSSNSIVMGMWDVQKINAFKSQHIRKRVKSELDTYLEEEDKTTSYFDILMWWTVNRSRDLILSKIARDLLAVPVSTVASEYAFSVGGEIPKDKVMNREEINEERELVEESDKTVKAGELVADTQDRDGDGDLVSLERR
ncbi:hypothetical protein WN944_015470 [Citrus x changshan-huyou]|uniref:HAT C-terminal dimerisation domain-containing protein n=1 Tax=Citrus x changshan-huyou TaxID=2935761 RepID=A0AAP0M7K4_9ROSI